MLKQKWTIKAELCKYPEKGWFLQIPQALKNTTQLGKGVSPAGEGGAHPGCEAGGYNHQPASRAEDWKEGGSARCW